MNFVSLEFFIFLGIFLLLLALIRNAYLRKLLLLGAGCFFYAWWDWRFLGLLMLVTVLDYYITRLLVVTGSPRKRKSLLMFSIIVNLGFLGFFKYFNFFIETLNVLTHYWGWQASTLNIILPIGISFFIFETLSYVIDVYRGMTRPANSLLDYAIFIAFFPRLVAGPIMRASQFLPQLEKGVDINVPNIIVGLQYFLRGVLKKLVIADNVAVMVDQVYANPNLYSSSTIWLGVAAYSIQILYDFWGYTDMAVGLGKMLGFDLPINFNLPYSAQSITEFWTRWHISLSTWLRDYLYIPLGGNQNGRLRTYINLMITMLLGGLWHGASWNFVLWGGLHGGYLAVERMILGSKPRQHQWTSPLAWLRSFFVFILVTVTWVPFRSPNWDTTVSIFQKLLLVQTQYNIEWLYVWGVIAVPLVVGGGWLMRRFNWEWPVFSVRSPITPAFILFEFLVIFFYSPVTTSPFIYFQF